MRNSLWWQVKSRWQLLTVIGSQVANRQERKTDWAGLACAFVMIGAAASVEAKAPNGTLEGKFDCDEYNERRGTVPANSRPLSLKLFDSRLYLRNEGADIPVGTVTSAGEVQIEIKFAQKGGSHARPIGRFEGALTGSELKAQGALYDDRTPFTDCRLSLQFSEKSEPPLGHQPVKYPCMSNVCLGDVISSHIGDTPWVRLPPNGRTKEPSSIRAAQDYLTKYARGISAAERDLLAPHVTESWFDQVSLRVLTGPKVVFCRRTGFGGLFYSESGYQTRVSVAYFAGVGFRVTMLERFFPSDDKIAQRQIAEQVREQYPFLFDQMGRSIRTTNVPWTFGSGEFASSKLVFTLEDTDTSNEALSKQRECLEARPSLN